MAIYTFPSDLLSSEEYGHMVWFYAFTPLSARAAAAAEWATTPMFGPGAGTPLFSPGRQMLDSFQLYIPGGAQNNLVWSQRHDYDDVKMSRIGSGAASGIMSAITGIGADTIGKGAALAGGAFRTTINPYVEVLYRGTDLRAYDMSFMFAPQSKEDALQLYGNGNGTGILNRFRFHAAPQVKGALGIDDLLFGSPSEWEVMFLYKNAHGSWVVNPKIPKIAKGVLARVDVDYNPDSEFSTYEHGEPTAARLTMRFVEMEIIDKSRIEQGF